MNNLAYLQYSNGNQQEAMALARESLDIKREAFGNEHPEVADGLYTIGLWTMDSGDYAGAEILLRESLAMNIELRGRVHSDTADSVVLLANCLIARNEHEEALNLAREARDIYVSTLCEDHWRTAVAIGAQGAALSQQGGFEQAEPLLLRSHEVLAKDPNARPRYVQQVVKRLAALYSAWGKPDRAAEFQALLEE